MNFSNDDLSINENHQDNALDNNIGVGQKDHSCDEKNPPREWYCYFPKIIFIFISIQEYSIYSENLVLFFSMVEELKEYEDRIDDNISPKYYC